MTSLYCSQGHDNPEDNRFCRLCGEQLNPMRSSPFLSGIGGQLLDGRYRIVRELGQGGFGRTYLAEDMHRFSELCVLKEFAPQVQGTQALQKAEELFTREAGVLYQLQHPQIPRFREVFRSQLQGKGHLFLVQDYVEGQTYHTLFKQRLNQGQTFSEAEVTQLLFQLLPVLSYIHAAGVIHRDISPDNLILRSSDQLPVLIDFGGVKQIAATVALQVNQPFAQMPISGVTRLGKAGYAPEEQMEMGAVYPHSDLYALAVTVLVLLTGQEPQVLLAQDRRQWQPSISPTLAAVLDRMLSPYPHKRYQSAQEVLQALGGAPPPAYPSPPTAQMLPEPTAATVAISPAAAHAGQPLNHTQAISPSPTQSKRRSFGFSGFWVFLLVVGAAVGGWWEWRQLFGPQPDPPKPRPTTSTTQPPETESPPHQYSPIEQARKQALQTRREELGVDRTFLVSLTDATFYAKRPGLNGRPLNDGAEDEDLRTAWDNLAMEQLDRLEALSPEARSRLGSYTADDLEKRRVEVNKLKLSSRALNDLADAQFFHLFPEQPRDQDLLKQPIGQAWQAVAADQLKSLQTGNSLAQIQFPSGGVAQQVNDSLKPGEGKAYIAKLSKDQVMRLILDAPAQGTWLSIYPPTSKSAALLEDSTTREWSGKLAQSGFYEIVVVSQAARPVDYTINLATTGEGSPTVSSGN